MSDLTENFDIQFFQLVVSLQAATMNQLGKVISPITGKIERDLEQAKQSIDMLEMIQTKTEGNLNVDEKKLLDHIVYELKLNYVDELKKGPDKPKSESTEGDETKKVDEGESEATKENSENSGSN